MTVAALPSKIEYLENGVTTAFALPFRFLPGTITASRVLASGEVVALVAGVDFSTSGGDTDAGGTLTLTGASISGARLRAARATPKAQVAVYQDNDSFPAASHEQALDRAIMVAQELGDRISETTARALMVPDGEVSAVIPGVAGRASSFLAFDSEGNPIAAHGTGADLGLREDLAEPPGGKLVLFDALDAAPTASVAAGLQARGRYVTDFPWIMSKLVDDIGPALRRMRDDLEADGGGILRLPEGLFEVTSYETREAMTIVGNSQEIIEFHSPLFLGPNISVVGAGGLSRRTRFKCHIGGIQALFLPVDWGHGRIAGLAIEGAGASDTSQHGIFLTGSTSYDHIVENVAFEDLLIDNVGSYGIGNNMQIRDCQMRQIETSRTGADGIDWKVHGQDGLDGIVSQGVFMSGITIRSFGQREGAGTPTGIGIRGQVHINGIHVYGVTNFLPGIDFVGGIADGDDYRPSGSLSTITNWYVEGADPKVDCIGLRCYSSHAVAVGPGVAKWCRVDGLPATATPYGFEDGATFSDVTLIPAHGRDSFRALAPGTAFSGCRVISDKVYFDAKRANLVAGQTEFTLPWTTDTASGAPRLVIKNGVTLTETTDYIWGADSFTLTSGVLVDDEIIVVFAPARGFRIEADNCSVVACRQDRHVPNPISFAGSSNELTAIVSGCMWDGYRGVGELNSASLAGLIARDPAANAPLVLQAKGTGALRLASSGNALGFFSGPGAAKQTVTGSKGGNAALGSLLAALAAYGVITDSSS